jgi:hypothetical protein
VRPKMISGVAICGMVLRKPSRMRRIHDPVWIETKNR